MRPGAEAPDIGSTPRGSEGDEAPPCLALSIEDVWRGASVSYDWAARVVDAALAAAEQDPDAAEVSLLLTDDARIQGLNAAHRRIDAPTDVLSWPATPFDQPAPAGWTGAHRGDGGRLFLGDVALAFETTRRDAERLERPLEHHAAHLIVHGVLHLLGYDHQTDEEAAAMELRESEALRRLDVSDPHADARPLSGGALDGAQ